MIRLASRTTALFRDSWPQSSCSLCLLQRVARPHALPAALPTGFLRGAQSIVLRAQEDSGGYSAVTLHHYKSDLMITFEVWFQMHILIN